MADRGALGSEASRLADELATAQNHKNEYQGQLAEVQRVLERLATRYDLLTRLRQEGEGLRAGVRTVLQAANPAETPLARPLYGVLGTVAHLLHVPAKFEIAIEVALGSHLEDVVVESWTNAEAAIAYLRAGQRGRVTFLPLDTVRPVPRLLVQRRQGMIGVAADLVEADDDLGLVVEMLLGRSIVVEDLKAARGVFDQLEGSCHGRDSGRAKSCAPADRSPADRAGARSRGVCWPGHVSGGNCQPRSGRDASAAGTLKRALARHRPKSERWVRGRMPCKPEWNSSKRRCAKLRPSSRN